MEITNDKLEEGLATPLDALPLPTRLANVLQRRKFRSLADLVRLSPEELLLERGLGRKSVYDARVAVRLALGTEWETARAHLLAREDGPVAAVADGAAVRPRSQAERWEALRTRLASFAQTPLEELEFPARVYTFADARGLRTLGDLLDVPWDDFATARNVGRGTLAATLGILEALLERLAAAAPDSAADLASASAAPPALKPIPEGARWLTLFRDTLAGLEGQERIIATQRSGLAGPIPTLHELGECFGVTRERIRQIEVRAIDRLRRRLPRAEIARRLARASELLVEEPEVVAARDPLFAFDSDEVPTLVFLVNDVLEDEVRAVSLGERLVFSRADKSTLQDLLRRVASLLEAASFPAEEEELARTVAAALDIGSADARALFGYLSVPFLRDGTRIVGFGRRREDEILAMLRAAAGPVARAAIEAQHGRGLLPTDVIFVDRGLVSLPEKVEGWDRWARRLPPLVRTLIEREGPERQWSTEELVDLLAGVCELPEWMNAWTLGSLLRRSSEVDYLGRNVVALPAEREASGPDMFEAKRVHLVPALEEILRGHGGPMAEGDARAALGKIRGASSHGWNVARMQRPFLLLDGGMLGLFPRDVPGGEARSRRVLGALHEWLFAEQKGLPAADVEGFLSELGDIAEGFTPRMLRSAARLDGRFRLNVAGAVGLSEWESVRVPTQREVLEELLQAGGGSVSVDLVRAHIVTSAGEPIARSHIATLASSVGARVDKGFVVRRGEREASRSALVAAVLSELPERTAAVFEEMLDAAAGEGAPPHLDGLASELDEWSRELRQRAATDAPHIEAEQVDGIEAGAGALLTRLEALSGEARALAVAAVRYVVCTDDAEGDFAVGGLDDDEAVVARVSEALGVPG